MFLDILVPKIIKFKPFIFLITTIILLVSLIKEKYILQNCLWRIRGFSALILCEEILIKFFGLFQQGEAIPLNNKTKGKNLGVGLKVCYALKFFI